MSNLVWPAFEFRPLPGFFKQPPLRYAEGRWIEDDGEYDTCFIGSWGGENYSLYFNPPYQRNIVLSWLTTHWTQRVVGHPRNGNPWHYALREGATECGGDWGAYNHPNRRAGDAGMSKVASQFGCANGRHIELKPNDPHIAAGLLRNRESKEVFRFADGLTCMYCGAAAPIKCEVAA